MIFIVRNRIMNAYLIFVWVLLAPIASGFAIDAPNYQRSLIFLPSWQVFEAFGWFYVFSFIKRMPFSFFYKTLLIVFMSINVFCYFYLYIFHTNTEYAKYWQYGYKEAIDYAKKYTGTEKRIFFANSIEQGYVFYLFYNRYDPKRYLFSGGSNRLNASCYTIDNAYFGDCSDKIKKGDIYITNKQAPLENYKLIDEIDYVFTKDPAVSIYERL